MSRPIYLARMPEGKTRPVLLLTREVASGFLTGLTVAAITRTIRGIRVEVPVGAANGLDHDCVVNLDNVTTISRSDLGRRVGFLFHEQEEALAEAIIAAFDLEV